MAAREAAPEFLYRRVERHVRDLVAHGVLRPGDRAPSLRRMSGQAGVSIATVTQAYLALEHAGLLEARARSGFYVRAPRAREPSVPRAREARPQPRPVRIADAIEAITAARDAPDVVSFGVANPAPDLLPARGLARAAARALADDPLASARYAPPRGVDALRRQIAFRLADLGCVVRPEDVLVTAGATEALAIALRAVARPGDAIAVESPCYFLVLQLIERLGMLAVEIPTDPDTGIDVEALATALDTCDIRAVLLVPNFGNPLGSLVPEDAKRRLVSLLAVRAVPLVEDDIYGDLHFGAQRPGIAKRHDGAGLVLTCSSVSKTMAPGYRVGWLLAGRYADEAARIKHATSGAAASLPQLAIAGFLGAGSYDRYLRRVRRAYADRVARMRAAIGEHFPSGTRVTRPQGGFVLWVELPRGIDGGALFRAGLAAGVGCMPGALFSPTGRYRNCVRIACGLPWSPVVDGAVAALGRIARRLAGEAEAGRTTPDSRRPDAGAVPSARAGTGAGARTGDDGGS